MKIEEDDAVVAVIDQRQDCGNIFRRVIYWLGIGKSHPKFQAVSQGIVLKRFVFDI